MASVKTAAPQRMPVACRESVLEAASVSCGTPGAVIVHVTGPFRNAHFKDCTSEEERWKTVSLFSGVAGLDLALAGLFPQMNIHYSVVLPAFS